MSLKQLETIIAPLPYNLRDQISGYARSVSAALPEIAKEANVEMTDAIEDKLVFFAGLSKLYSLCAAFFWAIDNAGYFLEQNAVTSVRAGSMDYSRGSAFHKQMHEMLSDIENILRKYELLADAANPSYVDLARRFTDGYRRD